MVSFEVLMSGFFGAVIGSGLTILFQIYRDKKKKEYLLARERLQKIYGPLRLILEANKNLVKPKDETFLFTENEIKLIDEILFKNYYLIEEKRKSALLNLYSHRKFSKEVRISGCGIIRAIKEGYEENSNKLKNGG
jgi:hypothetical protein